jgi:hypothetical protein
MATTKRRKITEHRGGMPARAGKASDVRISVLATFEEREAWFAAAQAQGTTLSDVARAAWNRMAKKGG